MAGAVCGCTLGRRVREIWLVVASGTTGEALWGEETHGF